MFQLTQEDGLLDLLEFQSESQEGCNHTYSPTSATRLDCTLQNQQNVSHDLLLGSSSPKSNKTLMDLTFKRIEKFRIYDDLFTYPAGSQVDLERHQFTRRLFQLDDALELHTMGLLTFKRTLRYRDHEDVELPLSIVSRSIDRK